MSKKDFYQQYMQSTTWKRRRAAAIKRAGGRCQECGTTGRLDVHHLTYERLGREWADDLKALCPKCHNKIHNVRPHEIKSVWGVCQTCGERGIIKIEYQPDGWTEYTCEWGHLNSKRGHYHE